MSHLLIHSDFDGFISPLVVLFPLTFSSFLLFIYIKWGQLWRSCPQKVDETITIILQLSHTAGVKQPWPWWLVWPPTLPTGLLRFIAAGTTTTVSFECFHAVAEVHIQWISFICVCLHCSAKCFWVQSRASSLSLFKPSGKLTTSPKQFSGSNAVDPALTYGKWCSA